MIAQNLSTNAEKIRQGTRNSLYKADEFGIKSLAFPALGTGVDNFRLDECARIIISEVLKSSSECTAIRKVVFALPNEHSYIIFKQELSN